jgi:hypothetical protein
VIKEFHIAVDTPSRPAAEMFLSTVLPLPDKVMAALRI